MSVQSDPNGEHLVNGFSWPFIKNHFRAMARANDADFEKKQNQTNGIAQASMAILDWMEEIDGQKEKFYTVEEAFQKLVEKLPEIDFVSACHAFTHELNETYNGLRRMVAPLQELKGNVYYRTASGMLAKVTRVHFSPQGITYFGLIFDRSGNAEGMWDAHGYDRSLQDINNLVYESHDQRSMRVLLQGIEACLEAYYEPIADEDTQQYIKEAQNLADIAIGRIED